MQPRKSLSDILRNGDLDKLAAAWQATAAADDFAPIPAGEYECRIISGEPFESKGRTPGYKLTLEVAGGEYAGRRVWHDIWLTTAALPMAKRDLGKLGVSDLSQLSQPLPRGILLRVKVVLRNQDDGTAYNRVRSFEVAGNDPPDEFAPKPDAPTGSGDDGADFGANATAPPVPPGPEPTEKPQTKAARPKKSPGTLFSDESTGGDQGDTGPYAGDRR